MGRSRRSPRSRLLTALGYAVLAALLALAVAVLTHPVARRAAFSAAWDGLLLLAAGVVLYLVAALLLLSLGTLSHRLHRHDPAPGPVTPVVATAMGPTPPTTPGTATATTRGPTTRGPTTPGLTTTDDTADAR